MDENPGYDGPFAQLLGMRPGIASDGCGSAFMKIQDKHRQAAGAVQGGLIVTLADYAGQTILVNLWATWCAPCRFETPYLQSVYEENQERGLMIVGVSVDSPSALNQVNDFLEEMGVTYDILLDPGMMSTDAFLPIGYPASYLIDGEGVIRFTRLGPIAEGDPEFLEALEQTLD